MLNNSADASDELTFAQIAKLSMAERYKITMDHLTRGLFANAVAANQNEDIFDVALGDGKINFNFSEPSVYTDFSDGFGSVNGPKRYFNNGSMSNEEYEQFLADLWVGIILTLMVLSCVCCMCSCLLYHKFQQWKSNVLDARRQPANNPEAGNPDTESLPSYTIASGLPSYDEALAQLQIIKTNAPNSLPFYTLSAKEHESNNSSYPAPVHQTYNSTAVTNIPPSLTTSTSQAATPQSWQPSTPIASLSVVDLFQLYRATNNVDPNLNKT